MSARLANPPKAMTPAGLAVVPLFLCFASCGPINVHVFENVGKGHGLETRATDDGLQTHPTNDGLQTRPTNDGLETHPTNDGLETRPTDQRAKVKLLLAGEAAPWDGVLITRIAFDAMADAANGKVGLQTRTTNDGLETRPTK